MIGEKKREQSRDRDGLHRRRGIWYFGYTDPATQKWHELSTGTANYTEARRVRADKMLELSNGELLSDKRRLKLEAAYDEWVTYAALQSHPNTLRFYRERSRPLLKILGHMRLAEISLATIRHYQQARSFEVSARTVNMEVQVLRNIMTHFGLWRGRLREDYKSLPETSPEIGRALTEVEEARCWEVAKTGAHSMRTYNLHVLLGNTGLRRSELLKLSLAQIDLEKREISVIRKTTKTDAGKRFIPLNTHAMIAAMTLIELAKAKGATKPEHFLFPAYLHRRPNSEETGYDPNQHQTSLRTAWRNFTRKCGLKGLRLHDRRHHFVTLLAESNTPVEAAKSIVGHMSVEMLHHYTHIRDRAKREAVDNIMSANVVQSEQFEAALKNALPRKKRHVGTTSLDFLGDVTQRQGKQPEPR